MPTCDVCGSESFNLVSGFLYCSSCQSQSQTVGVRTQDQRAEPKDFSSAESDLSDLEESRRGGRAQRESSEASGAPWSSFEALTHLLRAQVSSLLSLGVSPRFKEVVFQIWACYLRRLGVAFTEGKPHLSAQFFKRDLAYMIALRERVEDEGKDTEGDDAESVVDEESERENEHGYKIPSPSIDLLVAVIVIALNHCQESVHACDVLRLIRHCHFPYINATDQLPREMSLNRSELRHFNRQKSLFAPKLRLLVDALMRYLELPPTRLTVMPSLLARFCLELDLPQGLYRHALSLWFKVECVVQPLRRAPEVITLSTILLTLKLLFGLNDEHEGRLSELARLLSEHGQSAFVFNEWRQVVTDRLAASEAGKQRPMDLQAIPQRRSCSITEKRKRHNARALNTPRVRGELSDILQDAFGQPKGAARPTCLVLAGPRQFTDCDVEFAVRPLESSRAVEGHLTEALCKHLLTWPCAGHIGHYTVKVPLFDFYKDKVTLASMGFHEVFGWALKAWARLAETDWKDVYVVYRYLEGAIIPGTSHEDEAADRLAAQRVVAASTSKAAADGAAPPSKRRRRNQSKARQENES